MQDYGELNSTREQSVSQKPLQMLFRENIQAYIQSKSSTPHHTAIIAFGILILAIDKECVISNIVICVC